jgi:hypothetical protein
MRHKIHTQIKNTIRAVIKQLITTGAITTEEPLEYHIDAILLSTLSQSADHLLKRATLRHPEQHTLTRLKKDIDEKIDLSTLEQDLFHNLNAIKPRWGELFGTDRGEIYNTFHAIYQWPCFHWHTRLYHKEQTNKLRQLQTSHQSDVLTKKSESLETAQQILHRNDTSNRQLLDRMTQQFITIQTLKKENHTLRQALKLLPNHSADKSTIRSTHCHPERSEVSHNQ